MDEIEDEASSNLEPWLKLVLAKLVWGSDPINSNFKC